MQSVEIEIEVWCSCGEGLCRQSTGGRGGVTVEPCEKCLEYERDEYYNRGYEEGRDQGYEDARED